MGGQERFKIYGNVFDAFTTVVLQKLTAQGFFEGLVRPLSMGKEANVFIARNKEGGLVAVKIYRLENCNFNKMWSYLASDPRYQKVKPQRRQVIFSWVQREFRNLLKSREAGVRVPTPLHFSQNVVVEEFIGHGTPAPQLNKYEITDATAMYEMVATEMKNLYQKAGVIHGDLSAYNILVHEGKPVIIDMSQSTFIDDPNSSEYLVRDIHNIVEFFADQGADASEERLKAYILGKAAKP